MSALKQELIERINIIPDNKLVALKPLIYLLSNEDFVLDEINEDDLTESELESVKEGYRQFQENKCLDFEDYLNSRNEIK